MKSLLNFKQHCKILVAFIYYVHVCLQGVCVLINLRNSGLGGSALTLVLVGSIDLHKYTLRESKMMSVIYVVLNLVSIKQILMKFSIIIACKNLSLSLRCNFVGLQFVFLSFLIYLLQLEIKAEIVFFSNDLGDLPKRSVNFYKNIIGKLGVKNSLLDITHT